MRKLLEFELPDKDGTVTVSADNHLVGYALMKIIGERLTSRGIRLTHSCAGTIRIHQLPLIGRPGQKTSLQCTTCGSRTLAPPMSQLRDLISWVVAAKLPRELAPGTTMKEEEFDP